VAAEDAQFGMPELGFASYPALSGPTTMKRLLPKHAFEMALIPRRVDAHTAWRWGLVNEVVPAGELLERAGALARTVAALDPVTVAYTKRALHEAGESTWVAGIEQGALIAGLVHATRRVRDTGTEEAR
jgi:enoyl-CoA hydratase/carnithine racemase